MNSIVPLNDNQIINLARKAKIENASGLKRLREFVRINFMQMDLSDVEVIEAIGTYLIKRPIEEAKRLRESTTTDMGNTFNHIQKLMIVSLKVNMVPSECHVDEIMKRLEPEIANLIASPRRYNRETYYSPLELQRCETLEELYEGIYSRVTTIATDYLFCTNDLKDCYEKEIIDIVRNEVINLWSRCLRAISVEPNNLSIQIAEFNSRWHPYPQKSLINDLYKSSNDEINLLMSRLIEYRKHLCQQRDKIDEIITPIQKMSNDLSSYLSVAEDLKAVKEAAVFLNLSEMRSIERNSAIAMLAHYSEIAHASLCDLQENLNSYQSAQSELSVNSMNVLEVK